jgi:hypothetical protein
VDLVRALAFPFDDDEWVVKSVVGTVLGFVPGYQIQVARNVVQGRPDPLPAPGEVGQVLSDGVMAAIGALVYAIPIMPFVCIAMIMGSMASDSVLGGLLFGALALCITGLAIVYAIPATAMYWMGIIRYAETGNFSEFIHFGSLWADVREHFSTVLILLVYSILIGLLALAAGMILWITCIGLPLLAFWYQITTGHLIGQAAQSITRR